MSCTARASSLPGPSRDHHSTGGAARAGRCFALATLVALATPAQLAWAAAPGNAAAGNATAQRAPAAREQPPSAADRAAAQALYDQGRELMEAGRHAEACPRFEESERLEPGLGTRFHLATCYEALGRLASAHALYLEVAAEASTRKQEARERVARQRASDVEPKLSRLSIEVPYASSPALRIERDGALVGPAQWGLAVPVDPGKHRVNAAAPGRVSWTTEVDVPGDAGVTRVNVPPLAEQRQAFFEPLPRKIGLAALGVGVGTIALGSVFVAQAISKKGASEDAGCNDQICPDENSMELRRQALAAGDRATWAMGIGLVGLGAAAALFWVWPIDEDEGDMQLAPVADLNGGSLRLSGTF